MSVPLASVIVASGCSAVGETLRRTLIAVSEGAGVDPLSWVPFELARRALLRASPISSFCRLRESLSTVPPAMFGVGVDEPIFNFKAFGLVGCDSDNLKFLRGAAPSDCI